MYYDTHHTFDDFRQDYLAKFGKEAFVGPYMRKRWQALRQAAIGKHRLTTYAYEYLRAFYQGTARPRRGRNENLQNVVQ